MIDEIETHTEEFTTVVENVLENHPEGLSEYELLQHLREKQLFPQLGSPPNDSHALYCAHFLLFNALYQLNDLLIQKNQGCLIISVLKIQKLDTQSAEKQLGQTDKLRDYYLNMQNLENSSEASVNQLLNDFWEMYLRNDQRGEALEALGLTDPVNDKTIKETYRQLVMSHHPDRGGETEELKKINNAYRLLIKK